MKNQYFRQIHNWYGSWLNLKIVCSFWSLTQILAPKAAENLGFEFVDVSHIIKENEFFEGHDEQYDTQILDEDKLLDFLQVFKYWTCLPK
jgi:hypothetical protein